MASDLRSWEVSGLGTCVKKKGNYFVSDVWLIKPKTVGHTTVDQSPEAINELIQKLVMGTGVIRPTQGDNVSFVGGKSMKNIRFLWHSHVDFGVGWSGTDDATARFDFCPDSDWTVNLVVNTKGHFLARLDFPKENNELVRIARENNLPTINDTTVNKLNVALQVRVDAPLGNKLSKEYIETHREFLEKTVKRTYSSDSKPVGIPIPGSRLPFREERISWNGEDTHSQRKDSVVSGVAGHLSFKAFPNPLPDDCEEEGDLLELLAEDRGDTNVGTQDDLDAYLRGKDFGDPLGGDDMGFLEENTDFEVKN
jgi:hypothetical protein